MGAFDPVKFDSMPIGSVIQSPINLEAVTNGKWIALDGRDCSRSDYPELAPYFPAGVFTSTARTLAQAPAAAVIAADDTNFLASGAAGTTALQASATGATGDWTASSTWGASTAWNSIIRAGTRWVIAGSGGDASAPYVQNVNATAANTVPKANWTVTTSGTTTTLTRGLAYSPSLGRTVLCKNGSLATASGLFYLNDGETAWSACNGGSTLDRESVCWTGKYFISAPSAANLLYQRSADGITWEDRYMRISGVNTTLGTGGQVCSNGNGVVLMRCNGTALAYTALLYSNDHGDTWRYVKPVQDNMTNATINTLGYVGGYFVAWTAAQYVLRISADGVAWSQSAITTGGTSGVLIGALAHKSGVWCGIKSASTAALTSVEDKSKFQNHINVQDNIGYGVMNYPHYIKARS